MHLQMFDLCAWMFDLRARDLGIDLPATAAVATGGDPPAAVAPGGDSPTDVTPAPVTVLGTPVVAARPSFSSPVGRLSRGILPRRQSKWLRP